jgi:hypothetical protein
MEEFMRRQAEQESGMCFHVGWSIVLAPVHGQCQPHQQGQHLLLPGQKLPENHVHLRSAMAGLGRCTQSLLCAAGGTIADADVLPSKVIGADQVSEEVGSPACFPVCMCITSDLHTKMPVPSCCHARMLLPSAPNTNGQAW